MEYCNEFFDRMETIGYENFKDVTPKNTVQLLQSRLYPIRSEMLYRIYWATTKTLERTQSSMCRYYVKKPKVSNAMDSIIARSQRPGTPKRTTVNIQTPKKMGRKHHYALTKSARIRESSINYQNAPTGQKRMPKHFYQSFGRKREKRRQQNVSLKKRKTVIPTNKKKLYDCN